MLTFRHATRASQGARSYQEDAAAVWASGSPFAPQAPLPPDIGLAAVLADGMGGHAAGDVASTTICGIFLQQFAAETGTNPERLAASLTAANDAIHAQVVGHPGFRGMGATCVGIVLGPAGLEWISVGDSPLFIFRGPTFARLNADHSLAPVLDQMVADGLMTADAARVDPRRHQLRAAVTGDDLDLVELTEAPLPLQSGDVVLLASDGLLTLGDEEIRLLLGTHRGESADTIADALLAAVDAAGAVYQDNTTVIVITAH